MRFEYGKELKRLRTEAGLLIKEAGAAVQPPVSSLSYWGEIERGTKAPLDIERTKQIEKFLLAKIARLNKKATSKLVLYQVCYRLALEFEGLSDETILKLGKEITRELYDDG